MSTCARRSSRSGLAAGVAIAPLFAAAETLAQPEPFPQVAVVRNIDSGPVTNSTGIRGAAFSTIVAVPGVAWLRLTFDQALLGAAPPGGQPTLLVLTSLRDGATQHHRTLTLQQWSNTSACFNGESVRLEIIADPGAKPSRVAISTVLAGYAQVGGNGICGIDDRLPSSDPRVCRTAPNGCTAFMISDYANCFLTAGHCNLNFALVEFNVPLSTPGGNITHPGPEDQYIVDQSSIQLAFGGIGNDWCYFGCFPNPETGLPPSEAQGAAFDLAATLPPVAGQTIRATGYGIDSTPPEWNQAQQTSTGPFVDFSGSSIQFRVDGLSGSSGSPLVRETNGLAIGIFTHGGCIANFGANNGTGVNNAGLQAALAAPLGVCLPAPPVAFVFPGGLPQTIEPSAGPIRVEVIGANGGTPQPGTGMLHYDAGGGFVAISMAQVEPNVYDAVFPSPDCFLPVSYSFSAQATTGEVVENPLLAPSQHHDAIVATGSLEQGIGASDGASGDSFGYAVAMNGDVAVVGAYGDDDNGSGAGAAYVFRRQGATWVEEQKLLASDGAAGDSFGLAVAASGSTLLIGALTDDDQGTASGSAYVFSHDGSSWVERQKLLAPDGAAGQVFGGSVAIDGGAAIVGSPGDDDAGSISGSAYVFRHDGEAWVPEQKLLASDGAEGDYFGVSVAIDRGAALIGAYSHDDGGDNAGAGYVFRQSGSTWVEETKLLAAGASALDYFGYSVALSGDVALIGAMGDDDDDYGSNTGSVYEFLYDGSTWAQGQRLLPSGSTVGDSFGIAVAVRDSIAVIGAHYANAAVHDSGEAYIFRHDGASWIETQVLADPQGATNDSFGISVATDGGVALAGAWRGDYRASNSGSARFFETLCTACPGDLDGDGSVDIRDFLSLLMAWGTSPGGPPDLDGDGTVGQGDLEMLLAAWGPCG